MRLIEHWGSSTPRIIGRVKVVGLRESEFIFVSIFTEIKPMITLIIMPSIVPDKCRNFISTGSSSSMMKIKKKLFSVGDQITNYLVYGGLPLILTTEAPEDKAEYLNSLFQKVYISDIIERHNVRNKAELDELVDILASAIGSYTNQNKLSRTFKSVKGKPISDKTIKNYIDYLIDSYLISKAARYDIKGKKYIGSPSKYYFEDVGLRNARLGFRRVEQTHLMENIIYNELRIRGYHVDVGMVEHYEVTSEGKRGKKQLEVDFVATRGSEKYYIQSAFALSTADKVKQEQRSLLSIPDSFRKIIVVGDNIKVRRDENGIITVGLRNFLLDENSLKL